MPWHDAYSRPEGPVAGAFRMGLAPIDARDWLPPVDEADARAADRRRLLTLRPDAHHACPPKARAAALELLRLAAPELAEPVPDAPLLALAERVPDDLCLLSPENPPRLRAAVLTAASSWRLEDKIDRDVTEIHAPVDGLEDAIGARMRSFLDRLPAGRVFERSNWALYDDGAWDRSAGGALASIPRAAGACSTVAQRLWLRMERQTLRRLPETGWIVFTIRIHRHPLTELAAHPGLAADLRAAIASLDARERRARRIDHVGVGLDAWLAALAAPSDPRCR